MKKRLLGVTLALTAALALTACGGSGSSGNKSADQVMEMYPPIVENEGEPIEGGILKVALVSDAPLTGFYNPFFSQSSDDTAVMQYTMAGAVRGNESFEIIQDDDTTPLNIHIDAEEKTVSIKINPKFKWNNGDPVTTADIVKTFEIVANQDYINAAASVRFDGPMRDIEGIMDYNEGKADTIKGLEVKSPSEMVIHYTKMTPSILYGQGMPGDFIKADAVEGVPMDKIPECDEIRKTPHSYGPFHIKKIMSGESVLFEPNEYYFKGAPKLDGVKFTKIPSSQMISNMQAGGESGYDIYMTPSKDAFDQYNNLPNCKVAARMGSSITLLNFKQGYWDFDKGECVYEPDRDLSNVALKKAMALAIDKNALGEKFSQGLSFQAETSISPLFAKYHDADVKGIGYDMEEANKILDEAGFKDVDGDGFRENPKGEPLTISYVATAGDENSDTIAGYYLQQWGKGDGTEEHKGLGLNVKMYNDRPIDIHTRWDMEDADSQDMQVWVSGYTLGSDPSPLGLYGKEDFWNFGRYTTPEFEEALQKTNSIEALDHDKAVEIYNAYDRKFQECLPAVPMMNTVEIMVVNNRVKHYDFNWYSPDFEWNQIELTADEPIGA